MITKHNWSKLEREAKRIHMRDDFKSRQMVKWGMGDRVETNTYHKMLVSRKRPFHYATIMVILDRFEFIVLTDEGKKVVIARCWCDKV